MTVSQEIGEAELHAYLDGELTGDGAAEVEAWLADNPEAMARLDSYRQQKAAFRSAFDPVLDEPVPDAMAALLAGGKPRRRAFPVWLRAAAAIFLFASGMPSGWLVRDMAPDGGPGEGSAMAEVALPAIGAHRVYVSEVRHPVEVAADEEAHLAAWLSKRLGAPLRPPRIEEAGFSLVGGRLLPDAGMPAAQFMYEDGEGRRVTVYVRQRREKRDTAFRFVEAEGVSAFYWVDGPFAYALSGSLPKERLLRLSRLVYERLQNGS